MSLLLAVFGIVFVTELISWIGQSVLLEFVCIPGFSNRRTLTRQQAYRIYLRVFYSSLSTTQTKLKAEILNTKTELLKTSAQDQFAKWAKLRRSVDKGLAELETLSEHASTDSSIALNKPFIRQPNFLAKKRVLPEIQFFHLGSYDWASARCGMVVPQVGCVLSACWMVWPSRMVAFIPFCSERYCWVSHRRSLSLHRQGSISVGVWSMACKRFVKIGERVVKDFMSSPGTYPC